MFSIGGFIQIVMTRDRLNQIDPSLIFLDNACLLYLKFPQGLQGEDILLLSGASVEVIIILRGSAVSVDDFVGHVRYMRSEANYLAMPALGLIPGSTHMALTI